MQTPLEAITLPALHSRTRMTQILARDAPRARHARGPLTDVIAITSCGSQYLLYQQTPRHRRPATKHAWRCLAQGMFHSRRSARLELAQCVANDRNIRQRSRRLSVRTTTLLWASTRRVPRGLCLKQPPSCSHGHVVRSDTFGACSCWLGSDTVGPLLVSML